MGWYHLSYMVTKLKSKGHYGEAYGYKLTDGKPKNGILEEEIINCCGCGNWELIENLIEDVDNLKWDCLDENYILTFGRYKGISADEVKTKDEEYYKWALGYVSGFHELLFSRKYNVPLQELLHIRKQIKKLLSFFLDQYKYSTFAKQKDINITVKEIGNYYSQNLLNKRQ